MTPPRSSEEPTLREMERADPFAPHAGGCQCWPHVSQRAAVEGAVQAATAEYRAVRDRGADPLPDDTVCACLDETGERKVRLFERCERCGALMAVDRGADPLQEALDIVRHLAPFDERDRIVAMNGTVREPRTPADFVDAYRTRLIAALGEEPHGQ